MVRIDARFSLVTWAEEPTYKPDAGARLAHARITYRYQGELEGEGEAQSILRYTADGSGTGLGFERVTGTLRGRTGSFVLEHHTAFGLVNGQHKVTGGATVVPGTGTGGFAGLKGSATLALQGQAPDYPLTLDLELPGLG